MVMRIVLVLCKIVGKDSDGTLEYGEWFEGGRQIVYKDMLFAVGGCPFLLSLLIVWYSKASYNLETGSTSVSS
jgi:hypothetical protein